jgi:hypothetical protein
MVLEKEQDPQSLIFSQLLWTQKLTVQQKVAERRGGRKRWIACQRFCCGREDAYSIFDEQMTKWWIV